MEITENSESSPLDAPVEKEEETCPETAVTDPFEYLDRGEFTSEKFKIEISNLPRQCRKYCYAELKKRLTKTLHLNPHKIKAIQKMPFAFVTFRCEEDRQDALKKINGHRWKESVLEAKKAQPSADPLLKKRKQQEEESQTCSKKVKQERQEDNTPPDIRLKNSVTPLWNVPYEQQLKIKIEEATSLLKFLVHQHETREFFTVQRKQFNGMCCELLPIIPCPVLTEYRNKSEFSVGKSLDGQDLVVGFRFGLYRDGNKCVGRPDVIDIIPDRMKKVVQCFEQFLKESNLAMFDPESHHGHWHQLTVRTTLGSHIMAVVEFHPQHLSQEELGAVKMALGDYFSEGAGRSAEVTSLYFHLSRAWSLKEQEAMPFEHIHGETHIYEDLLGMKFRISPDSFFQVNTLAAEQLYSQIVEWCDIQPDTVVLDICCGTGTIGLSVAKKAHTVIGFEMCKQAVEDARANAQLNGITNITFHCGKVEDVINGVMKTLRASDVVAIVDPPRAGLHKTVVKALRSCSCLKRLVYASCSPKSVKPNFTDLIRKKSKKHLGESFIPVKAMPIDLFPQTRHCELVVLFERLSPPNCQQEIILANDIMVNNDMNRSTQIEGNNESMVSEEIQPSVCEEITKLPELSSKEITRLPELSSKEITRLPELSSQEITKLPELSSKEITKLPELSSKEITKLPELSSQEITKLPELSSEDITKLPELSTEEITKLPELSSKEITKLPELSSKEITKLPELSSKDITKLPELSSQEIT